MTTLGQFLNERSEDLSNVQTQIDSPVEFEIRSGQPRQPLQPIVSLPHDSDPEQFLAAFKGLQRSQPGSLCAGEFDPEGHLRSQFQSGKGVLKLWVGMPDDLLLTGIRGALDRSNGQSFVIEHLSGAEVQALMALLGRSGQDTNQS